MDATNYNSILKSVESGRCVLFLGSEVAKYVGGSDSKTLVKNEVVESVRRDAKKEYRTIKYYDEDDFYLFSGRDSRTIPDSICDFYAKIGENYNVELYDKLAQIPFHLIVSLAPDQFLLNSIKKYNPNVRPKNWGYIKDEKFREPDQDNPLVYYLFGNIDDQESLVLTHEKFFKYAGHILNDDGISKTLISCIQKASYFIFLGIRFDKWYAQLFVRLIDHYLEKSSDNQHLKQINEHQQITTAIYGSAKTRSSFYKEQFGIELIDSVDIENFVDKLFTKAQNYDGKNLLRKKKIQQAESKVPKLYTALNNSKYDQLLDNLPEHLPQNEKRRLKSLKDRYETLLASVEGEEISKKHEENQKKKILSLLRRSLYIIDEKYTDSMEEKLQSLIKRGSKKNSKIISKINSIKNQWEDLLDNQYSGVIDETKITQERNKIRHSISIIEESLN